MVSADAREKKDGMSAEDFYGQNGTFYGYKIFDSNKYKTLLKVIAWKI